jgi:hypothetical protein
MELNVARILIKPKSYERISDSFMIKGSNGKYETNPVPIEAKYDHSKIMLIYCFGCCREVSLITYNLLHGNKCSKNPNHIKPDIRTHKKQIFKKNHDMSFIKNK